MTSTPRVVLIPLAILLCFVVVGTLAGYGTQDEDSARPIPEKILYPGEFIRLLWDRAFRPENLLLPECEHAVRPLCAVPRPIAHVEIPQHPFMAPNGGNNMHCDSYISDVNSARGPLGAELQVTSRTQGFGGYGTMTFDRSGRLIAVHSNGRRFQLELMDPDTLEELASYDLPARPWYWLLQGIMPWEYIGAGMYFYLDHKDRAVIPTTENTILVVQVPEEGGEFSLIREYDLEEHVIARSWPHRDSVAWVLPDWSGDCYWFATTGGVVGTVEVDSGDVHTLRLEGEIIENSFAASEDGVFILSDHALYRFRRDCDGSLVDVWRTPYDRGPGSKPGHITRGSGTSVSLLGGPEGLVAFTDNAEPRINLLLARRSDGAVACGLPLFAEGKSGTDISVACFERADPCGRGTGIYSVLAENNWGHHSFPRSRPEPGLVRVDVVRCADGSYVCNPVWSSDERSIGVFKLSLGSGLAYMYWRSEMCPVTTWFLTAIDFATGETVYRKRVGTGLGFNNWAGAMFLHPDGGTLYSTTIFGLLMIRDEMP